MRPLRLFARNYRMFGDLDYTLPDGCVAVTGPNGAGKTSLVSLIDVALFADGGRELAQWVTTGELDMTISLEFEHQGRDYRVRRTYSAAGRGRATLDFETHVFNGANGPSDAPGGWHSLNRETAAATQQAIEDTLRLTRATFRASAFSGQGDQAAFASAAPKDRKAMLAEILGLDLWAQLLDLARADAAEAAAEITQIAAAMAVRQETVARKDEVDARLFACEQAEKTARAALEQAASTLEHAQAARATADAALTELAALRAAATRAGEDLDRAARDLGESQAAEREVPGKRELLAAAEAATDLEPALEQELANAQAAAEAARERDRHAAERDRTITEAAQLDQQAKLLHQQADHVLAHVGDTSCDRCGQTLGHEAAERAAASLRADADKLDARMVDLTEKAQALDAQYEAATVPLAGLAGARPEPAIRSDLMRVRQQLGQKALLEAEVRALEQKRDQIPELADRHDTAAAVRLAADAKVAAAQDALPDINALNTALTEARRAHDVARAAHESSVRQHAACQTEIDQVHAAEQELADLTAQRDRLQDLLDLYKLAEKAYGRDGIPALILENSAIPQIETDINRMLERMPMSDGRVYRCELRTQRALKSRDGLAEVLDIVVLDGQGERPFETYSGGEQARIALGIRLGLSRLLATRRGAELKMLTLDELDGLEEDAMLQLVDILREHETEFGFIAVVSHHPILREAFDQRIVLSCEGGRSTIATPAAPEAVPA